jgi:hypothetical protein
MNHNNKSIIIGIRGTQLQDPEDIKTDIALTSGLLHQTQRYKDINDLINRLKNIYPNHHITVTGHSLGATLSKISNADLSFGFNEGTALNPFNQYKPKNQYIGKRVEYDPISYLSQEAETLQKDPQYDPHTIKQFANLQTQ